ncbi:hypothetical protein ACQ5SO_10985 [Rhodovulum sp. DZ06]|uniref:hypothetical protein n=1 Tax=Rhodovulum sp. DZ06 TaxID=3425126 RepID=UPI003D33A961
MTTPPAGAAGTSLTTLEEFERSLAEIGAAHAIAEAGSPESDALFGQLQLAVAAYDRARLQRLKKHEDKLGPLRDKLKAANDDIAKNAKDVAKIKQAVVAVSKALETMGQILGFVGKLTALPL